MQNEFLPYTDLDNRSTLSKIGHEIIMDVAPEEELTSRKWADDILLRYEQGDVLVAETSENDPGGFGDIDLVTLVVIPLLISTVSEICKQFVVWSFQDLKKWANASEDNKKKISQTIDVVVEEKFDEVNRKVKSRNARTKGNAIRKAVKIKIKNNLEVE